MYALLLASSYNNLPSDVDVPLACHRRKEPEQALRTSAWEGREILSAIKKWVVREENRMRGKEIRKCFDLSWAVHCDYVVKKANRWLYALRQLKKCKVSSDDIVHIYCMLICSILECAFAVFANLPTYLACCLENVQKRASPLFGLVFRMKQHLTKLHYTLFCQF